MVIEKVHGLRATGMSMNDRFTILAMTSPIQGVFRQQQDRRLNSVGNFSQNSSYGNRLTAQQFARRLNMQAKRAISQRLGTAQSGFRRFGSEGNLSRLVRSNSWGNLSQSSIRDKVSWRQSNGNLSRSASFSNLSSLGWRGFRRRNGGRQLRGRNRGRGRRGVNGRAHYSRLPNSMNQQKPVRPQTATRARRWARAKGGVNRNNEKPTVTKEELDLQLDQYMAGTKAALDLELDNYMKNVMDIE